MAATAKNNTSPPAITWCCYGSCKCSGVPATAKNNTSPPAITWCYLGSCKCSGVPATGQRQHIPPCHYLVRFWVLQMLGCVGHGPKTTHPPLPLLGAILGPANAQVCRPRAKNNTSPPAITWCYFGFCKCSGVPATGQKQHIPPCHYLVLFWVLQMLGCVGHGPKTTHPPLPLLGAILGPANARVCRPRAKNNTSPPAITWCCFESCKCSGVSATGQKQHTPSCHYLVRFWVLQMLGCAGHGPETTHTPLPLLGAVLGPANARLCRPRAKTTHPPCPYVHTLCMTIVRLYKTLACLYFPCVFSTLGAGGARPPSPPFGCLVSAASE